MPAIGSLTVDLIAQTASFNANIAKAASNLNSNAAKMNRSIQSLSTGIKGLATGAVATSLLAAGQRALDYAAGLGEVSSQLGVTTRDLQVYRYAATQVGITQDEMDNGLQKLTLSLGQASLGAKAPATAFKELGVSITRANGDVKTAGEVIPELARALAGVESPARRAAIAKELFGRSAMKLLPLLEQGEEGVKAFAQEAEKFGLVLSDKVISQADAAADAIARVKQQVEVSLARAIAENSNALFQLANAFGTAAIGAGRFITQLNGLYNIYQRRGGLAGVMGVLTAGPDQAFRAGQPQLNYGQSLADVRDAEQRLAAAQSRVGNPRFNQGQARDMVRQAQEQVSRARAIRDSGSAAAFGATLAELPTIAPPSAGGADGINNFLGGGGGGGKSSQIDTFTRAMENLKEKAGGLAQEFRQIDEAWSDADIAFAAVEVEALRVAQEDGAKWTKAQREEFARATRETAMWAVQVQFAREGADELAASLRELDKIELDVSGLDKVGSELEKWLKDNPPARISSQWQDMTVSILQSVEDLAYGIKGGGFLDILSGVVNLLLQLGSSGLFGQSIATNINKNRGFRQGGWTGSAGVNDVAGVVHGQEYVFDAAATRRLGIANLEALRRGRLPGYRSGGYVGVARAGAYLNRAGGRAEKIEIVPSKYFDVIVDGRAARVAAPMSAQAALQGSSEAQQTMASRQRRRIR